MTGFGRSGLAPWLLLCGVACGGTQQEGGFFVPPEPAEAQPEPTPTQDAGRSDAGAAGDDSGTPVNDAGVGLDAGNTPDAGRVDGGALDAGRPDAGVDAGVSYATACELPSKRSLFLGRETLDGSTQLRGNQFRWNCQDDQGLGGEESYDFQVATRSAIRATLQTTAASTGSPYWMLGVFDDASCASSAACDTDSSGLFSYTRAVVGAELSPGAYRLLVDADQGSGEYLLTSDLAVMDVAGCEAAPTVASGQTRRVPGDRPLATACDFSGPGAQVKFSASEPGVAELSATGNTGFRTGCTTSPVCRSREGRLALDAGDLVHGFGHGDAGLVAALFVRRAATGGTSCASPQVLAALDAVLLEGDTTGGTDSETPNCGDAIASPDQSFQFDVAELSDVTVELSARFDATLTLRSACASNLECDRGSFLVSKSNDTDEPSITQRLGAGRYHVVVDGENGLDGGNFAPGFGPFTLRVKKVAVGCAVACGGVTPYCFNGACRACTAASHCTNPFLGCCSVTSFTCVQPLGSTCRP